MFLTASNLQSKHGFFTREGGKSTGEFSGLNCGLGSGDDLDVVRQNRDIVREKLGGKRLVTLYQIHSDVVHIAKDSDERMEGDALVTDKPGIAIGILAADCCPILFEDKKAGIIGAAHAGWKGARFGIISSTIRAMQSMGAQNIHAAIGPCIQHNSYEVSHDFAQGFGAEGAYNADFFTQSKREGHFMFNLPGYIEMKLQKHGIENISNLGEDTLTQPEKFYSYRRMTLAGGKEYGRQISAICLP